MHYIYGALPAPYVPEGAKSRALVAHRYTYSHSCCSTSQYRMTIIPLSVFLWNDLAHSVFDGVGLASFKSRANLFLLAQAARSFFVFYCFLFYSFFL